MKAQIPFGKAFELSSNGNVIIGNKEDFVEIVITDYVHKRGYSGPPEINGNYFEEVHYHLKMTVRNSVKNFTLYHSKIKDNYTIDLGDYSILILSDEYGRSVSLIEMIVNKK